MLDLTEENEALTALIKGVEDKVAEAGYAPGVCVEDSGRDIWQILNVETLPTPSEFIVWLPVKRWLGFEFSEEKSGYMLLETVVSIVPNPEEQDG